MIESIISKRRFSGFSQAFVSKNDIEKFTKKIDLLITQVHNLDEINIKNVSKFVESSLTVEELINKKNGILQKSVRGEKFIFENSFEDYMERKRIKIIISKEKLNTMKTLLKKIEVFYESSDYKKHDVFEYEKTPSPKFLSKIEILKFNIIFLSKLIEITPIYIEILEIERTFFEQIYTLERDYKVSFPTTEFPDFIDPAGTKYVVVKNTLNLMRYLTKGRGRFVEYNDLLACCIYLMPGIKEELIWELLIEIQEIQVATEVKPMQLTFFQCYEILSKTTFDGKVILSKQPVQGVVEHDKMFAMRLELFKDMREAVGSMEFISEYVRTLKYKI